MTENAPLRVLLLGNPNTGKTTVFNRLTGFNARVGNYAGVTVERKAGTVRGCNQPAQVIDLPGTYSLNAHSPDECVTVEVLLGLREEDPHPPDRVLLVADASNLERNLFLVSQVLESGLPSALLLNMTDVAEARGITIQTDLLSQRLGIPVFPLVASKGQGFEALLAWLDTTTEPGSSPSWSPAFPEPFVTLENQLLTEMGSSSPRTASPFLLRRLLLDTGHCIENSLLTPTETGVREKLQQARQALEQSGIRLAGLEPRLRYQAIQTLLQGILHRPEEVQETSSDRWDAWLLHPVWGTAGFLFIMMLVFQAIYSWAGPLMDLVDGGFALLAGWVRHGLPSGALNSFLADGVIAGVGGVLVFLPQIILLFLFVAILEDCGYLARAAFLADRLFSHLGLSGRSFIPLLSSFACAIPGIMATRTIPDPRSRLTTILISPLMSCSARLPVYLLMTSAFVPSKKVLGIFELQGLVLFSMYLVGPVVAAFAALILRKTLARGGSPAFLMELPPLRFPGLRVVAMRLLERAGAFLKQAGTLILAVSIVVWAASYYPRPASVAADIEARYAPQLVSLSGPDKDQLTATQDAEIQSAYLRQSWLGRAGRLVEPVVAPLGWDWRIGMAVLASFPAREVVVATLGVIFGVGDGADQDSDVLKSRLVEARHPDGRPLFTLPVALSIMVFFALCAQCAATLAVIRRETNSWFWPTLAFAYMTALAWIGAFLCYHGAGWFLG